MRNIVLLGDSVFDNGAYVEGGPDVVDQLRSIVPAGWPCTLSAVDGALTAYVKPLHWLRVSDATEERKETRNRVLVSRQPRYA
jgi:hypothetical protein